MKIFFLTFIFFPIYLHANFIALNSGVRSLAMGNAFVALANDPITIFYNSAGLSKINEIYFLGSRQNLYGIPNLYNDMFVMTFPTPIFRTGFGIQKMELAEVYSEQIVYFSISSIIRIKKIPIRFGSSLKYESAKVQNLSDSQNPSNFDFDLGLLIDLSEDIYFGFSIYNFLEPEFKFISEFDQIHRSIATGIYYNWRNSVNFLADYFVNEDDAYWNLGSEMWFYDVFAARLGVSNEKLTSGFGLKTKNWILNGAVMAHEQLGSTYRMSIGYKLNRKV